MNIKLVLALAVFASTVMGANHAKHQQPAISKQQTTQEVGGFKVTHTTATIQQRTPVLGAIKELPAITGALAEHTIVPQVHTELRVVPTKQLLASRPQLKTNVNAFAEAVQKAQDNTNVKKFKRRAIK